MHIDARSFSKRLSVAESGKFFFVLAEYELSFLPGFRLLNPRKFFLSGRRCTMVDPGLALVDIPDYLGSRRR